MKTKLLTTTAAIVLLASLPAMASGMSGSSGTTASPGSTSTTSSTRNPDNTGVSASQSGTVHTGTGVNATVGTSATVGTTTGTSSTSPTVGQRLDQMGERASAAVERATENVRDLLGNRGSNGAYSTISVDLNNSISGIIGQSVYDARNEKVAKVEDILFDQNGQASKMVLSNGGIMGIGDKLVVVDFGLVYARTGDNDVIVPLTEDTIKRMTAFSYDADDASNGMQTLAAGQISAKAMLDGELLNEQGKEVGSIENITLTGNKANQVVVAYNTTLGMGGDKIAVPYDQLQRVGNASEVDFKLPSNLSARYETYTSAHD